jgi:preprotein translocase subunit YajC
VSLGVLLIIVLLFGLLWVFMIRPQRRRQMTQIEMLQNLQPGDEVLTAGGLIGHVRAVEEDEVTVEIAPGTNVRLDKRAVAGVVQSAGAEEPEAEESEAGTGS